MAQEVVEQVSLKNVYPNYWEITDKIQDIISKYKDIENGARITETNISLIGRVLQKREASKKLVFYTIIIDGIDFQIISDLNSYSNEEDFYKKMLGKKEEIKEPIERKSRYEILCEKIGKI